ncbi:phytochrome-like protein cph2 [bacterium BMS3Abin12]|nr:phytochrome-like protein cph2 [bacterium BMS3Abin12]
MNIRRRFAWLILVAALPAVGTVFFVAWREYGALRASTEETAMLAVRTVSLDYGKDLHRLRIGSARLAAMPALYEGSPKYCAAVLARVVDLDPLVSGLAVMGPNGRERCGSGSLAHAGGSVSSVPPATKPGRPRPWLLDLPLPGGGRLLVDGRPGRLARRVAQELLPSGSSIILIGRTGRIRARWPGASHSIGKPLPPSLEAVWAQRSTAGLHALLATGVDGIQRLYVINPLRIDDGPIAYLLVGIPEARLLIPVRRILIETMGLGIATLVVLLVIFALVGKIWIDRPLRGLLDTIERFDAGDEKARSPLDVRRDEFGVLARGFNRLADHVERNHRVLEDQLEQIERLNRAHQTLSGINQVLLRMRDRTGFLQAACRIAVEQGGLRMAWIGEVDSATDRVRVVAQAGPGREVLDGLSVSADGAVPEGRGTVGPSLRSGTPQVVQDIESDPRMAPWREALLALGCRAALTFPLAHGGHIFGNLTLYAATANAFDEASFGVYRELAGDIAFGMNFLQVEGQRDWLMDHDAATDLPNHRRFLQWFTDATATLDAGENLSVGVLQVDQMAELRTRHGREAVDTLRREIGTRLAARLAGDDLLAVLSEDDFLLAWYTRPGRDVTASALDLLSVFPLELRVAGEPIRLNARLGLEPLTPGVDVETLIHRAALAVRSLVPADERRLAFYSAALETREKHRFELLRALERASLDEEFRLVYQPHVDLASGRVLGAEALLRWKSPTLGDVPPGEFIPAAEQSGQIRRISQWVMGAAFERLHAWQEAGVEPGVVSINLSARDCADTEFVASIRERLARSGLDPHRVGIAVELTETDAVTDLEHTAGVLRALKSLGFSLYLDDFGTGFASMSHLVGLPLDAIKIDLSFIQAMFENPAARSVTEASIALGHGLGLQVIAEGVETEAQLEALRALGCDAAQGYLINRPLEVPAFEAWLRQRASATPDAQPPPDPPARE